MKLVKLNITSFRSIKSAKIDFLHDCIGLVGVNESGKSNLLEAIHKLNINNSLTIEDKTKDASDPTKLIFQFDLDENEVSTICELVTDYATDYGIGFEPKFEKKIGLEYEVKYSNGKEARCFKVLGIKLPPNVLFLRDDFKFIGYQFVKGDEYVDISDVSVIDKKALKGELDRFDKIASLQGEKEMLMSQELEEDSPTFDRLIQVKEELSEFVFNYFEFLERTELELNELKLDLESEEQEFAEKNEQYEELKTQSNLNTNQEIEFSELKSEVEEHKGAIVRIKSVYDYKLKTVKKHDESLEEQFVQDEEIFYSDLSDTIYENLVKYLPQVHFWTSKEEYILPSAIRIKDLIDSSNVPRPLINMFSIALNIRSQSDFIKTLEELRLNGNKRSSANAKLNSKVNDHIQSVWPEYDQRLNISVEESQIRIEVFDPARDYDAEFYELQYRSQGCKTFLSFILTLVAESKTKTIKNQILLLDEPESHLHPSGQRFMLREMQNMSKSNLIVYATHSNHMIIKDNYDQHLIVKKRKDRTTFERSEKNRIGFFMQEEVLYDAIGVDLSSEVPSIQDYNFVFEGLGDVVIFKQFYDKAISATERPFKIGASKFYQGGKCSDIKRVFIKRPIQLGSKWVFILDSDTPAYNLSKFIAGKYKDYINKDIFVFHYPKVGEEGELEDLIPRDIIKQAYLSTFESLNFNVNIEALDDLIDVKTGYGVYSDAIYQKYNLELQKDFSPLFKQNFNQLLIDSSKDLTNREKFEKKFPDYFSFAMACCEKINGK